MKVRMLCLLTLLALVGSRASAEDRWKSFIGKSNCIPELSSPINRYGVRLDRHKKAYVMVYKFKDSEIVTVVQYQDESKSDHQRCGVIRDVAQVHDNDSSVVWGCSDQRMPAEVIIGTWPAQQSKPYGMASEAWRVDLNDLRFIPVEQAAKFVYCRPEGRGNDEGNGLSDWARQHAGKHPSY